MGKTQSRRLLIRLSSLGDLVLSTAALEVDRLHDNVDWVVASEFASLLDGHSKINRVWHFQRSTGLLGWLTLCRELWDQHYDEIYDLHVSLRSRLARLLFYFWGIVENRDGPTWIVLDKQRARLYGYFLFKRLWPKSLRPISLVERFSKAVGGTGTERPNLQHLIRNGLDGGHGPFEMLPESYICVMPSAQWAGKRWPVGHYVGLLKKLRRFPVVLGSNRDHASHELVQCLRSEDMPHFSGVGRWGLPEVAGVLARSGGYIGNDTGLAHLAEAVGVRSWILYGPTASDMGFGPWRPESKSLQSSLWCRPCGKDGRYCFRIKRKYFCLSGLSPDQILSDF